MRPIRHGIAVAMSAGLLTLSALAGCGGDDVTEAPGGDGTKTTAAAPAEPAGPPFTPCTALTVEEVGAALGGPVIAREGGGCLYTQTNPLAPSVSITNGVKATSRGGIEGSKTGAEAQIDGTAEALSGVGDAAYVVVGKGKMIPTEHLQGAGAVVVKGQLITVAFTQGQGLPAEQVKKLITDVLTLIATKA